MGEARRPNSLGFFQFMEYKELLKHPYWQRKRLQIFDREKDTCQKCFDTLSNLQVHHLYYIPNALPWEYPDDALMLVCERCHLKLEFYKWIELVGVKQLKPMFIYQDIVEITDLVKRRLDNNHCLESINNYISDIKRLIYG